MLFKKKIRLEGCGVQLFDSGDKLYRTTGYKIEGVTVPTDSIKEFLDELEGNYWLNLEEFGYGDLPAGKPDHFVINFRIYSFSDLTKMYLVLKNDTTKFTLSCCEELLDAIATTLSYRLKHVSIRIKRKVLRVLNDPLFLDLKGTIIAAKPPDSPPPY